MGNQGLSRKPIRYKGNSAESLFWRAAVSRNLRRLLTERDMSCEELAELSCITKDRLQGILQCDIDLRAIEMALIARAFLVDVGKLTEDALLP